MSSRALLSVAVFATLALLAACASAPTPTKTAKGYFQDGETAYVAGRYDEAIAEWKKVRETYSSPELTTQAELKIADAQFNNKAYIEAAAAYEDFRKLHPTHPKNDYALYRLALSNYNQITGIDTDQTPVKNAVLHLENFLTRYPDSEYAPEARQKLADCRIKQLQYENYVGNFYVRTGKYAAAIKRLNEALVKFPNSPKLDETLFNLGKAYLKSGNLAQGKLALQRLAKEFPASKLNQDAAKLQGGFAGYSTSRS